MEVRAIARFSGLPPRKMRLLVDTIRGKKVDEALATLKFMSSPKARYLAKVVKSAAANAENNFQMSLADLRIIRASADDAPMMKRFRPRARGRANQILKRSSHITVVVSEEV